MANDHRIPVPAVGFNPPVYTCFYNNRPFILDGRLNKDFWQDIPFTELFTDIEGDIRPKPRFNTRAKLAWDDNNLYVGAILEGPEIWATLTERESVIFYDNDFEIFVDPDSDTQQYYEYEMNALNTVWDLMLTKAYRDLGKPVNSFDFNGLKSAVYIDGELNNPSADNHFWSVEIVLPFKSLGECALHTGTPKDGEFYRVNFSRVQWLVDIIDGKYIKRTDENGRALPEDNWVWAPTGVVNIHYPELWSFLFFSKDTPNANSSRTYAIPENEYRKWELRKLYYAQQAYFDNNKHYCNDIDELKALLSQISPCEENRTVKNYDYKLETTSHFFEITCPDADNSGLLAIFADGRTTHYKMSEV